MSDVVKLHYPQPEIAEVILEDHESRNTFSSALIKGLMTIIPSLDSKTKVLVIHGYENYFCCGGT